MGGAGGSWMPSWMHSPTTVLGLIEMSTPGSSSRYPGEAASLAASARDTNAVANAMASRRCG